MTAGPTHGMTVTTGGAQGTTGLADLLDRLIGTGVVLHGDLVISLAEVDLVEVRLRALLRSVAAEMEAP
ncbi:gas vesicle protein [Luteipulveratus sp. YIM 133132]|uniref:gas vesicle protein n=1 Tax=Luteipulveratus flavus TaxID=3031728 RepID=UPI0023B1FF54|nr:gas vesicle protein [Luteipulveratus sp. YIM 133132]MDE9366914.1 gas vesicle protein [Luteipulveratus sp. YIM 133132]